MKTSEAHRRASQKFVRENVIQIGLHLNKNTDADIIEWLSKQPSKMGAIKEAIREKMKREG